MSKFEIGDKVKMPGVPFVVTVLEVGTCDACDEDGDACEFDGETFRFEDPDGQGDDWSHTSRVREDLKGHRSDQSQPIRI